MKVSGPDRPWTVGRVIGGLYKHGPAAAIDLLVITGSYVLAFGIRTGGRLDEEEPVAAVAVAVIAACVQVGAGVFLSVYWRDWRGASIDDLVALAKVTSAGAIFLILFNALSPTHPLPTGSVISGAALAMVAEAAIKLRPRWPQILQAALGRSRAGEPAIVVGSGRTGQDLARYLADTGQYRVVCFIDDESARRGTYVRGIRIAGTVSDLPQLIGKYNATAVIVALDRPDPDLITRVVDACADLTVQLRTVAGIQVDRSVTPQPRALKVDELLPRTPVDLRDSGQYLAGKRVLVTGAAGSVGSELARQVAKLRPARLMLLDQNESGLFDLAQELAFPDVDVLLVDIVDAAWLSRVFRAARPEVVLHAAAYKHVGLLQDAVDAALWVNVVGTANVLAASLDENVETVVTVSTDKAVTPVGVMGTSKRFAELLSVAYGRDHDRRFAAVRFGNVLGSVGSVVPIFDRQIDRGGPVTVTDPQATRFFMTISEAAGLVLQAGGIANNGDILVLDMGTPFSIMDLARRMIRLRGLRTPQDIAIDVVGLRPGEKLHEELIGPSEKLLETPHERIGRVRSTDPVPPLEDLLSTVRQVDALLRQGRTDEALAAVVNACAAKVAVGAR